MSDNSDYDDAQVSNASDAETSSVYDLTKEELEENEDSSLVFDAEEEDVVNNPERVRARFPMESLEDEQPLAFAYPVSRRPNYTINSLRAGETVERKLHNVRVFPALYRSGVRPTYRRANRALALAAGDSINPGEFSSVEESESEYGIDLDRFAEARRRSPSRHCEIDGTPFVEQIIIRRRRGRRPKTGWIEGKSFVVEKYLRAKNPHQEGYEGAEHLTAGDDDWSDSQFVQIEQMTKSEEENLDQEQESDFTEDPWSDDQLDPDGESKLTVDGELSEGREYKFRTFRLVPPRRHGKPNRLYTFSIDLAKLLGFRDSGSFYNAHPDIPKLWTTQKQRDFLVEQKILLHRNMYRPCTVVPVRTSFRRYGRRVIRKGKRGIDDYNEKQAATGKSEDENEDELKMEDVRRMKQAASLLIGMVDEPLPEEGQRRRFGECKVESSVIASWDEWEKKLIEKAYTDGKEILHLRTTSSRQWNARVGRARRSSLGIADWNFGIRQVAVEQSVLQGFMIESQGVNGSKNYYPTLCQVGQYQSQYPITKRRFQLLLDVPELIPSPVAVPVPIAPPGAPIGHISAFATDAPLVLAKRALRPNRSLIFKDEFSDVEAVNDEPPPPANVLNGQTMIYCGFHSKATGKPCKRPVTHIGQRCLYHKDGGLDLLASTGYSESDIRVMDRKNGKKRHRDNDSNFSDDSQFTSMDMNDKTKRKRHTKKTTEVLEDDDSVECLYCNQCLAPPLADSESALLYSKTAAPVSRADRIRCDFCRRRSHLACAHLLTAQPVSIVKKYSWRCNECKVCSVCRETGDESTLLICDGCDRAWHAGCVSPHIDDLPEGKWLCGLCKRCHSCEVKAVLRALRDMQMKGIRKRTRGSSSYDDELDDEAVHPSPKSRGNFDAEEYCHPTAITDEIIPRDLAIGVSANSSNSIDYHREVHLCTYCPECYDDYLASRYCPCCLVTYGDRANADDPDVDDAEYGKIHDVGSKPHQRRRLWWYHVDNMICCDRCDRWTHAGCDPDMSQQEYQALLADTSQTWVCPLCRLDDEPDLISAWTGHRVRAGVRVRQLGYVQREKQASIVEGDAPQNGLLRIACVGQRGDGAEWFSSTYMRQ